MRNGKAAQMRKTAVTEDFIGAVYLLNGALFLAAGVYTAIAAIRSKPISAEEQQRADMRSCSWPTNGQHLQPTELDADRT